MMIDLDEEIESGIGGEWIADCEVTFRPSTPGSTR